MCMNVSNFSLRFSPSVGAYTGFGYKYGKPDSMDVGKWYQASGNKHTVIPKTKSTKVTDIGLLEVDYPHKTRPANTSAGEKAGTTNYPIAFHIFLNKNDAALYGGGKVQLKKYNKMYPDRGYHVWQVEYREVLSYGNNDAGAKTGPCVIALYMRYVKKEVL